MIGIERNYNKVFSLAETKSPNASSATKNRAPKKQKEVNLKSLDIIGGGREGKTNLSRFFVG